MKYTFNYLAIERTIETVTDKNVEYYKGCSIVKAKSGKWESRNGRKKLFESATKLDLIKMLYSFLGNKEFSKQIDNSTESKKYLKSH